MRLQAASTAALAAALLALAGCDRDAEPTRPDAGGEVLEGSISDAMLPYDTVRSRPPLAEASGEAADRADAGEATPDAAPPTP